MGQAVVDLPDPIENSKPAPSADDMLAQLASDEIDRLLADSDNGNEAAPAPAAISDLPPAKVETPALAATSEIAAKAEVAPAAETAPEVSSASDDAQRKELLDAAPAESMQSMQLMELRIPPTLPAILRPLEWISAPLDTLPDSIREFVGRAAVLTMINAIALLGYVWIFRRHR
jgi:hypothetical protein